MQILLAILFVFLLTEGIAGLKAAPWVPTWKKDIQRFLEVACIKPRDNFYDLGCGDGRLTEAAAKAGANATGFEISLLPYILAKIRVLKYNHQTKNSNFKIKYRNFFKQDLSDADVVYLFLTPKINPKVADKLKKEMKPGSRVIAYVWPLDGWTPLKINQLENQPNIYLYQI